MNLPFERHPEEACVVLDPLGHTQFLPPVIRDKAQSTILGGRMREYGHSDQTKRLLVADNIKVYGEYRTTDKGRCTCLITSHCGVCGSY